MPDDVANAIAGDAPVGGAGPVASMGDANFAAAPPGAPEQATGDLPGFSTQGIGGESTTLAKIGHAVVYAMPFLSAIQQHREGVAKHQQDEFNNFIIHSAITESQKGNPDIWEQPQVQKAVGARYGKQNAPHIINTMASLSQAIASHRNSFGNVLASVGGDITKAVPLALQHGVNVPPPSLHLYEQAVNAPGMAAATSAARGYGAIGPAVEKEKALRPEKAATAGATTAARLGVETSEPVTNAKVAQAIRIATGRAGVAEAAAMNREARGEQRQVRRELRQQAMKEDAEGRKVQADIEKSGRKVLSATDVGKMQARDADGNEITLTPGVTTLADLKKIKADGGSIGVPGFFERLKNFGSSGSQAAPAAPSAPSESDARVNAFVQSQQPAAPSPAPTP